MLQMKISYDILDACDAVEEVWYGDYDTGISRSYLVSRALAEIFPKRDEMDWIGIEDYATETYPKSKEAIHTELDLSDEEIKQLEIMRNEFVEMFNNKKIYKPFVIKMLLAGTIYTHMWDEVDKDMKAEELKPYVLAKFGTLNVQDYTREYDKEFVWQDIEEAILRNDIIALQEFIPGENCKWIDKCENIQDKKYRIITPAAWTRKQKKNPIAVTLIRDDIVKDYKALKINNDKDTMAYRYTYGILTLKNDTKIRLMNVYMPQLFLAEAEAKEQGEEFWKSLLDEIREIPFGEKLVLLGDFNTDKGLEFHNHDYFRELGKLVNMLDVKEEYSTRHYRGVNTRVDYIFVSGQMALEYSAITSADNMASEMGATNHILLEATFVEQRPFLEYCKKMLRIEDYRDWVPQIRKYED